MRRLSIAGMLATVVLLNSCYTLPEGLVEPRIDDQFTYYQVADGLLDYEITSLFEDSKGNIWIGSYLGLTRFDGENFVNIKAPTIVSGAIIAIGEDSNGHIWIGSENGYSQFGEFGWATETGLAFTAFHLDQVGNLWIGTGGAGALRYTEASFDLYYDDQCDNCNYVTDFLEDESGDIWFTSLGGVYHVFDIENADTDLYTSSTGLSSNFLTTGARDKWGNLLFGAYDAEEVMMFRNGSFTPITLPTGAGLVSDTQSDGHGVYISLSELGLLYYDGVVMKEIKTPQSDYYLNCLLVDSKGNVWIGTADNGLIKYQPKTILP